MHITRTRHAAHLFIAAACAASFHRRMAAPRRLFSIAAWQPHAILFQMHQGIGGGPRPCAEGEYGLLASLLRPGQNAVLTSPQLTSACSTTVPCICAGVEMEALTGAAVAALTVYDMCKAVDKSITIQCIQLNRKAGGKSGDFSRRE